MANDALPPFGSRYAPDGARLLPHEPELRLLMLLRRWHGMGFGPAQMAAMLHYGENVRHPRTGEWFSERDVLAALGV